MKKEKDPWQLEMDMSSNVVTDIKKVDDKLPETKLDRVIIDDKEEIKTEEKEVLVKNYKFVVVDIETTGLKPQAERLTEIVALRYNHNWDYMGAVYHNLLNPVKKIPQFISDLTGITQEMVKYKPYGGTGAKDLLKGLNIAEDILVAHNAKFEYDWLTHYESGYKLAGWICTRAVYLFMRDGNTWDNNFTKNYSKLEQVCGFYGIEYKQADAHRAEYDVLKTALVAEKMIKKIGIKRCMEITEAYVHGKGFGFKPKKTKEQIEYENCDLQEFDEKEEMKSRCAGAPVGPEGKEGPLKNGKMTFEGGPAESYVKIGGGLYD